MSDPDSEVDVAALHKTLIDDLIEREAIASDEVAGAFRAVPRHLFLPDEPFTAVYTDRPIVTKTDNGRSISSSSQPAMMAIMLEQLAVQPGEHVLEVGAGTGYNAALLGRLVGENGRVTTIDLDADTAAAARSHLQAAGAENVQVVCGDGAAGFAENAPYDCLILTVGGWDITPEWLAQLKPDGRLLLPLSLNGPQVSVLFARENGRLHSTSIKSCGFMRLRGPNAEPEFTLRFGPEENMQLSRLGDGRSLEHVKADEVYAWLMSEPLDLDTAVTVTRREIWRSLALWLALHESDRIFLEDMNVQETSLVPYLYSMVNPADQKKWRATTGVYSPEGMAFLMQPPNTSPLPQDEEYWQAPFPLFVRGFGPADTAVQRLRAHILAWDQAGRPGVDRLHIQVDPISKNHHPLESGLILQKKWHQFSLQWQAAA